jgi:hypothetical protein
MNANERALEVLPIYPMIVAMRQPFSDLGFYMEHEPCPNCYGHFLYALELNANGAPVGYCRCSLCGWEAVDAVLLLEHYDPYETKPIHVINEVES